MVMMVAARRQAQGDEGLVANHWRDGHVAESVDALDLGSSGATHLSSSLSVPKAEVQPLTGGGGSGKLRGFAPSIAEKARPICAEVAQR
jgi:hypothetical protein